MTADHTTCDQSEELLVRQSAADLAPDDAQRLQRHLDRCPDCRRMERTLGQFAPALASDERPRPEIQLRLRRQLKTRHPLAQLAHIRIPAYQALLGTAAAVLLLLATGSSGPPTVQPARLAPTVQPAPTPADSYEVMANVHLLDRQRLGTVHAEDSLLIDYPTSLGSI